MMATPPSSLKKKNKKRRSLQDSPSASKFELNNKTYISVINPTTFTIPGHVHQWVPLTSDPSVLIPSSKKDQYDNVDPSDSVLPGGLVKLEERALYCTITALTSINVGKFDFLVYSIVYVCLFVFLGEHVPIRPDSMLIHPVTMETLGIAIATSVLVECGQTSVSVCRVWPCLNLPLDGV